MSDPQVPGPPALPTARALARRVRDLGLVNRFATSLVRAVMAGRRAPACVVRHLPRVGLVESRLPNGKLFRLWSRGDDWVPNQVFWLGWQGYEPETSRLFFSLAERARLTIDVGAHVGFYALLAAHANGNSKILALEPVPATFERLRVNVALNGVSNVECLAVAANDVAGEAPMHVPRDSRIPCSAGLSGEFYRPWAEAFTTLSVNAETIDKLVGARGYEHVDLIKVDTEGTEAAVLRGAGRVLLEHRPFVVCEVLEAASSAHELEQILVPLGYVFDLLTFDGPVRRKRIQPHPVHANYLFSPA